MTELHPDLRENVRMLGELLGQSIRRKARRSSIQIAGITNILQETLSGIRVVKAFAMEKWEISRFMKENLKYFRLIFRQC